MKVREKFQVASEVLEQIPLRVTACTSLRTTTVAAVLLTMVACGKSNFSSEGTPTPAVEHTGQTTADPTKPGGSTPPLTSDGKPGANTTSGDKPTGGGVNVTPGVSDDQKAIDKCLAAWSRHPFGQQTTAYRKINAAVQVLGFGTAVKDDQPTAQPELILISAAVGVLGKSTLQLLNPNGWYCLKVDVNVLSQSTIDLGCQSHLADSRVNVNVLSNSDPAGVVGVQVLSDVKVVRRPGC